MYDLILRGGTVVDPGQGVHDGRDVAIAEGRVAAIEENIPATRARDVLDMTGKLVVPGLIDVHTHLYEWGSPLGCSFEEHCLRRGVTTAVDAGTSGSLTFPGFATFCARPAQGRVLAFVNLASIGIIHNEVGELRDMLYADPDGVAETISRNREICVGLKLRLSGFVVGDHAREALDVCLDVARDVGCPIMVHIYEPAVPLPELFAALRPGDIVTHVFQSVGDTVLGADGKPIPQLWEAQSRGVLFDVGHGRGGFSFAVARAALDEGFRPDLISTDLTIHAIDGPVHDLPTTMSKLLALGMPLDDVIAAATETSARAIGRATELGTLRVGTVADVTVLELVDGPWSFTDGAKHHLQAPVRLWPVNTIAAGHPMPLAAHAAAAPL